MVNYWHMQMHPNEISFSNKKVFSILEHKKIIGLGEWEKGESKISTFINDMKVNDIVAIKNGAKLIALVQVIGGAYAVDDDSSETGWIENRRPIRVLDWDIWDKTLPQPRGTLEKCVNDVETTKIIKEWHKRVLTVLEKRGVDTMV